MSLLDLSATDNEDTHKRKARKLACKGDTDFAAWKDNLKNPDPMGPPIAYMKELGIFQPLPSMTNPIGLCHFYAVDPASVSMLAPPKPPGTAEHLKGLLLLAKTQHQPYIVVVFQGGTVTALGLLQELHTRSTLAHIPIFWSDETKDGHRPCMSCCPFCVYTIQNDPAYLNHIVGMHYRTNFACGTCLSAVTASVQQMKRHLKECPGLTPLPKTTSQQSASGERSPRKSAHGSKHSGSKKKSHHSKKSRQHDVSRGLSNRR